MKRKKIFNFLCFLVIFVLASSFVYTKKNSETRIVPVKVVIDKGYFYSYQNQLNIQFDSMLWKQVRIDVAKKIKATSQIFKKEFSIKFKVKSVKKIEVPVLASSQNMPRIYRELLSVVKKIKPPKDGIVVWITNRYFNYYGYVNSIGGRYCVVTDSAVMIQITTNQFGQVLAHEIGHLFGARHVDDPKALMCGNITFSTIETVEFDKKNKEIILRNKWLGFKNITGELYAKK